MAILNTISLESNKRIKVNFNGGDLSSDGGLLLIKEFASRIGLIELPHTIKTEEGFSAMSDNIIQLNEAAIKGELKDLVKNSMERILWIIIMLPCSISFTVLGICA